MSEAVAEQEVHGTALAPAAAPGSLLATITRLAMEPDLRIDVLTLLLDRQERAEAKQAEREFNRAMVAAQAEIQPVVRDAENQQTRSRYARLETIDAAIRPIYTRHGFSLSFNQAIASGAGNICITCRCAHEAGHVEAYEREEPPDVLGAKGAPTKTALHGAASTETYLRRYITCGIFNVQLCNDDRDGNVSSARKITYGQAMEIERQIKESGADRAGFMAYFRLTSLLDMRDDDYVQALNMLHAKAARRSKSAAHA